MAETPEDFDSSAVSENLRSANNWVRLLYIILFWIIFNAAELVIAVVTLIQFLSTIFTGEPNPRLKEFGSGLSKYMHQLVDFFTYHSDERPFPFSPWPEIEEAKPRTQRRRTASKTASKKVAAKAADTTEPEADAPEADAEGDEDSKES